MNKEILMDSFRITGTMNFKLGEMRRNNGFMALYFLRKVQSTEKRLLRRIYKHFYFKFAHRNGIEIPDTVILGGGAS